MIKISEQDAAEIFAAAAASTYFQNTNLGHMTTVSHGGYRYRVMVDPKYRALIDGREGWGGTEHMHVNATPAQDRALRAAIKAAGK